MSTEVLLGTTAACGKPDVDNGAVTWWWSGEGG